MFYSKKSRENQGLTGLTYDGAPSERFILIKCATGAFYPCSVRGRCWHLSTLLNIWALLFRGVMAIFLQMFWQMSLAPVGFSCAVFTWPHFQKVAQISSWFHFHSCLFGTYDLCCGFSSCGFLPDLKNTQDKDWVYNIFLNPLFYYYNKCCSSTLIMVNRTPSLIVLKIKSLWFLRVKLWENQQKHSTFLGGCFSV